MDYGKAFVYMFADPNWLRKLGIGALLGLLGIVLSPVLIGLIPLIMLLGYSLGVVRNVMDGQITPLPEWDDWGGFLVRGLKLLVASFVWSLPAIILAIPFGIGSALLGNRDALGAQAVGWPLVVCGSCLMLLWVIFVVLISPAICIRLAATDRLGSTFEVGRLWRITREHLGPVIIAILLVMVASFIASFVGSLGALLCGIGLLITIPLATLWQYLVIGHLFGQIGGLDRAARSDELMPLEPVSAPSAPVEVSAEPIVPEVTPMPEPVEPPAVESAPTPIEPPTPDASQ
jgi:hypothetical protein